jgi:hypothetical protein
MRLSFGAIDGGLHFTYEVFLSRLQMNSGHKFVPHSAVTKSLFRSYIRVHGTVTSDGAYLLRLKDGIVGSAARFCQLIMKSRIGILVRCCLLLSLLSSCAGPVNHLVDPVSMPVFTESGQGEIQLNYTGHAKYYLEGAYALPYHLAIVGKHTSWQPDQDNDQSMSSIAAGKFWSPSNGSMFMLLGGYGAGSQRIRPTYNYGLAWTVWEISLEVNSDFRKYFVEALFAERDSINLFGKAASPLLNSWGVAARAEYLDRYRFSQIADTLTLSDPTKHRFAYSNGPQRNSALDLAFFMSFGMGFLELCGQVQIRFSFPGYVDYVDYLLFTCGLRFSF